MARLLDGAMLRVTDSMKSDLQLACQVVISMDEWTKKSPTSSFLAVSASFSTPQVTGQYMFC